MRGETVATDDGQRAAAPTRAPARWGVLSALLGLLVWYPGGGWPGSPWWGLGDPLGTVGLVTGYVVLLGGTASAVAASLVVRDWWARLLVLLAASVVWGLVVPVSSEVILEPPVIGGFLLVAQVVGFAIGSVLRRGVRRLACGVAVVAGLFSLDGRSGWLLVLALLVAAAGVEPRRPRALLAAGGVALLAVSIFLGTRLLAFALVYGWGDVRRGSGYPGSPDEAVARVLEPMADFLRVASGDYVVALVTRLQGPLLVGAVLAVVLAVARYRLGTRRA